MGWQMYDLTKDPLQLGLIGLTAAIPALSLALFAGWLVDRFNPIRFYQCTIILSGISMLISWHATDAMHLYLAAFTTGLARSFTGPSVNAVVPRIVTREELKRGSAWTTTAFKSATVIGPGVAGVLLAIRGYDYPYMLAIGALVGASISVILTKYRHVPAPVARKVESGVKETFFQELLVGSRYVFSHPLLLAALSLDMFAVLFGGVTALLPIYAAEILHEGPRGLGLLRAAPAAGAIFMSVYLIRKPITGNAGRKLMYSVLGFGFCILVFGVSRDLYLSMMALALSGAFDSVSMVVRGAIVQLCSPEHMRGRIAAVNSIFIGSSNEIGEFESGLAASYMGTVPSVIFGGSMTLLTVVMVFWKAKGLRNLDLAKI